ncbi:MAG: RNA polymerase sporulation sigma factor SigK [Clostridiales bacterium]|jgi:RNA polymerase sporulation-specific sigma factor|nr:RNA polymerase sporulation sigma factor SigK [Clostridiales bacterium]
MIIENIFTFLNKILLFTSYVNGKGTFPQPLAQEEEKRRLELARQGDRESKEILIRHNLRLVAHIVKKYNNAAEVDDMISIGSIGLIKAINTYEYGKGSQLATYAAKCIDNEILMYLRANKKHRGNVSLHDPMGTDREGNEVTLMDLLSVKEESVTETAENNVMVRKIISIIRRVLPKREAEIICMRYGIGTQPLTQREVALKLKISRSYISRIEKKALARIREEFKTE